MFYLQDPAAIDNIILQLTNYKILWVDTEVAHWDTPNPKLSLIQVLSDPKDRTGDQAYILDVFNKPQLIDNFISKIMRNPLIEKVFHNAVYDLKYLGKDQAKNITCTYKISQKISLDVLGSPDRKLKSLAIYLGGFSSVDTEEQSSDWGRRPLTTKQLAYAKMDTVYLAQVHHRLLAIMKGESSEVSSFSATQVRLAFECPRLFYLHHHFGGKTLFIPEDHVKGVGSAFHDLSAKFIQLAKTDSSLKSIFAPEVLDPQQIINALRDIFYEQVFYPYVQQAIALFPESVTQLYQIWQGITQVIPAWVNLLVKNRQYCSGDVLMQQTFRQEELSLDYEFVLPDNTRKKVTGKLDSVVFDYETNRYCVVEYKSYKPSDISAQLGQVGIYGYMLSTKHSLPIDCAVYCVLPEFQAYYYSWEQLQETVYQLIPDKLQQMQVWLEWKPNLTPNPSPYKYDNNPNLTPNPSSYKGEGSKNEPPVASQSYLCEICPQQQKCQSFFPSSKAIFSPPRLFEEIKPHPEAIKPHPEAIKPTTTEDAEGIAHLLLETLQAYKINADYVGSIIAPAFIRVKLKPRLGLKVASILKLSQDLQVQLGLASQPLITTAAGYVSVDLPRRDRAFGLFNNYIQKQRLPEVDGVKIALGIDLNNKLIEADLSDPNTCHFLVGGTTGSGKSEFLRALILSLVYRYSPEEVKIILVDPKRVSFPEFETMPWLLCPIVKDNDQAIQVIQNLVTEMEDRYQLLEKKGCNTIKNYNHNLIKEKKSSLPYIVAIFDEYADMMAEKENRTSLEQSIKSLGAMSRAAGIHLIIATQRPDASVVTPLIRSNLPARIALRTASEADSKIILGGNTTQAHQLLGKGDLFYQAASQLERLQSLYAPKITL